MNQPRGVGQDPAQEDLMLVAIMAYIYPGKHAPELISKEMIEHSGAQVMSLAQAETIGLTGFPPHPEGGEVWIIVARERDRSWIAQRLDANPLVSNYQMAEIET